MVDAADRICSVCGVPTIDGLDHYTDLCRIHDGRELPPRPTA